MACIFRRYFFKYTIKEEFYLFGQKLNSIHLSHQKCFSNVNIRSWSHIATSNAQAPIPKDIEKYSLLKNIDSNVIFDETITSTDITRLKNEEGGILEPCDEDVSDISPFVPPSYNLAAYANKSHTLQQFVKLGVELYKIEKNKEAAECILKLDFEKDVKEHLRFLHDVGVSANDFGKFITKNPLIFKETLDDLEVRINYLEAKKFVPESITRIITKNPKWLSYSTIEIDKRLGYFQRTFVLSGDEVRYLTTKRPQLITYTLTKILDSAFAVKVDMGFTELEEKTLLLNAPKLYNIQTAALKERFHYVHNIMGLSHERILQHPSVLLFRNFIVKQRHEFLKELDRAQYDPKLPGYVSLEALVHGTDVDFCRDVARTSIDVFNAYLKSC